MELEAEKEYSWQEVIEFLVSQIPSSKTLQDNIKEYTGVSWGAYNLIKKGAMPKKNIIRKVGDTMKKLHGITIEIKGHNSVQIVKSQVAKRDNVLTLKPESDREKIMYLLDKNMELESKLSEAKTKIIELKEQLADVKGKV